MKSRRSEVKIHKAMKRLHDTESQGFRLTVDHHLNSLCRAHILDVTYEEPRSVGGLVPDKKIFEEVYLTWV